MQRGPRKSGGFFMQMKKQLIFTQFYTKIQNYPFIV